MKNVNKKSVEIPPHGHLLGFTTKILAALEVSGSHNMGEYSADRMRCISKSISYFKSKAGNAKKIFCQRQEMFEGQLIIRLYRTA